MPKYRVERKCYFRDRLFDPQAQSVVNLDVKPKDAPRHFTCIDKPQRQQKQGAQKQQAGGDQGQASESSGADTEESEEKTE